MLLTKKQQQKSLDRYNNLKQKAKERYVEKVANAEAEYQITIAGIDQVRKLELELEQTDSPTPEGIEESAEGKEAKPKE